MTGWIGWVVLPEKIYSHGFNHYLVNISTLKITWYKCKLYHARCLGLYSHQ
jgi:hypothetical protein